MLYNDYYQKTKIKHRLRWKLSNRINKQYRWCVRNVFGFQLVVVFFGCHSNQLLGSFGNVIGALNDLLSDQLNVRRARIVLCGLLALSMEPAGTWGQQIERASYRFGGWSLSDRRGGMGKVWKGRNKTVSIKKENHWSVGTLALDVCASEHITKQSSKC